MYIFSERLHYSLQVLGIKSVYIESVCLFQGGLLSFQTSSNTRHCWLPLFAHTLNVLASVPRRRGTKSWNFVRGNSWHSFPPFKVLLTFKASDLSPRSTLSPWPSTHGPLTLRLLIKMARGYLARYKVPLVARVASAWSLILPQKKKKLNSTGSLSQLSMLFSFS